MAAFQKSMAGERSPQAVASSMPFAKLHVQGLEFDAGNCLLFALHDIFFAATLQNCDVLSVHLAWTCAASVMLLVRHHA